MRLTNAERVLAQKHPWLLRNCGNRTEFRQRMQWLSEGMLRNHMEGVHHYKIDPQEVDDFNHFKENPNE